MFEFEIKGPGNVSLHVDYDTCLDMAEAMIKVGTLLKYQGFEKGMKIIAKSASDIVKERMT